MIFGARIGTYKTELGEMLHPVGVCCTEHKDAIRLDRSEKSAFTKHAHDQPFTHMIDWSTVEVIKTASLSKEQKN